MLAFFLIDLIQSITRLNSYDILFREHLKSFEDFLLNVFRIKLPSRLAAALHDRNLAHFLSMEASV